MRSLLGLLFLASHTLAQNWPRPGSGLDIADSATSCNVRDPYSCDTNKLEICAFVNGQYRCLCPKGIARDDHTGRCTIRNECSDNRLNDCHQDAQCFDSLEGYRCICKAGFADISPSTSGEGRICVAKVNECASPHTYNVRCDSNAVCVDTEDSFHCECLSGYEDVSYNYQMSRGQRCVPSVDECLSNTHDCSANAECVDQAEGYTCRCRADYVDASQSVSNYPGRVCRWSQSYAASTVVSCTAGGNECRAGESCAYDLASSGYICKCPGGALRYSDQSCRQFDSCSGATDCDVSAICTNIFDSYQCQCPSGFADVSPDSVNYPGRVCKRRANECGSRSDNDCSPYAQCLDRVDGYDCVCSGGYMDVSSVSGQPPGRLCTRESDECVSRRLHSCDDAALCVDLPDGYACQCQPGFVDVSVSANLAPGRVCTVSTNCPSQKSDLMFVIDGSGSIGAGTFANEVLRFVRDFVELFDVGLDRTRIGAIQYSNMIRREFYMNEFTTRNGILNRISAINYLSGLTRTGKAMDTMVRLGFGRGNGARERSEDVARIAILITDGQSQEPHEIDPAARDALAQGITIFAIGVTNHVDKEELVRITGGYQERAFHVNDFTDLDVRLRSAIQKLACKSPTPVPGTGPCELERNEGCKRDLNEVCNWDGYVYSCVCPEGWTRNPVTQVCGGDICNPLISVSCERQAHCALTPYGNHRCRCNRGIFWNALGTCGSESQETCNPADTNSCDPRKGTQCLRDEFGRYSCQCPYPTQEDSATGICLRNECLSRADNDCHSYAECTDTVDSYLCQCAAGYRDRSVDPVHKPGRVCIPKNECALNRHNCSNYASCFDSDSGYTCQCNPGYVDMSPNRRVRPGRVCRLERDECADGSATCSPFATCKDTAESYRCTCFPDHVDMDPLRKPGRVCEPTATPPPPHPCDTGANNCSPNADCGKVGAGFFCRCKYGFEDLSRGGEAGRICERPKPTTLPPGTVKCGDSFCYSRKNEECVAGKCQCIRGYGRPKGSAQCFELDPIDLSCRVIREGTSPVRWNGNTFGNPASHTYDDITRKFDRGLAQSLDAGELGASYDGAEATRIGDPALIRPEWEDGLIFNYTIHIVKDTGHHARSVWRILSDYWRSNDWQVGTSGLYLDPYYDPFRPKGILCGTTQCRESLGEVCDATELRCVCDQTAASPGTLFGRRAVTDKCKEMEGFTYMINVLKYYGDELSFNSSFVNGNSGPWKKFAEIFTGGIGQTYDQTDYGGPYVMSVVHGYRNPNVISKNWERGVVFNYTSYFDKGEITDPSELYNRIIQHILVRNGKRIGTTGLTIADDQINTYSVCFKHTCDELAICKELPTGFENKYRCECPDGYVDADPLRKGGRCTKLIDFCYDIDYCPGNTTCVNTADQGVCQCLEGYVDIRGAKEERRIAMGLVGVGCLLRSDVQYCAMGLHDCSYYATCNETLASYECTCTAGFVDQFPDANPGRFCAGKQCDLCRGHGHCIADAVTRNTTCNCFEGWTGDTCQVGVAAIGGLGAGLIIALILAILFLLLALCCLGYFCLQSLCCGLCAAKRAESYSSADYGYGQMTIPRARLREGSIYSEGSEASSDYTVVERRIVTEEKKVTNLPATSGSAFLVYPPGTNVQGVQMAQITSGSSKAAFGSSSFGEARFSAADSAALTQDRELEEYTEDEDDSVSDTRSLPSTTAGLVKSSFTDDPSGFQGTFDKRTTTRNSHDVVPGARERFANEVTTKSVMNRY